MLGEDFEQGGSSYRAMLVEVDEAQLERAVVALRVMASNAIRPMRESRSGGDWAQMLR